MNLLLKKEVIIKSIAACSIEIILWSFQSVKQFKTVVDALEIDSYQFYKGMVFFWRNMVSLRHSESIEVVEQVTLRCEFPL